MLTTSQRTILLDADAKALAAVREAKRLADDTGWLGSESTNAAAAETYARAYQSNHERLIELMNKAGPATDDEVRRLAEAYGVSIDLSALKAGVEASSLGAAVAGTVTDTARTVGIGMAWLVPAVAVGAVVLLVMRLSGRRS